KFVGESALAHPCLTVDEKQHRTSGCDGKVTPPMATAPCLAHLTLLVVSREKLLYVVFPATKQPVAGGQRGSGASPPPRPPACPLVVWRFLGGRRRGNPRRGGRPEGVASSLGRGDPARLDRGAQLGSLVLVLVAVRIHHERCGEKGQQTYQDRHHRSVSAGNILVHRAEHRRHDPGGDQHPLAQPTRLEPAQLPT